VEVAKCLRQVLDHAEGSNMTLIETRLEEYFSGAQEDLF
jgi:hypothetical protein